MRYERTRYELDYVVYRECENRPGVYRREGGVIKFTDIHEAQEWCSSPAEMLRKLNADSGRFDMRCGDRPFGWEWLWKLEYDFERPTNRLPVSYRMWRDAIYNMSA